MIARRTDILIYDKEAHQFHVWSKRDVVISPLEYNKIINNHQKDKLKQWSHAQIIKPNLQLKQIQKAY